MADYTVSDSFSMQRCLTWTEPSRPVPQPSERIQSYTRARPVSGNISTCNFIILLQNMLCRVMGMYGLDWILVSRIWL